MVELIITEKPSSAKKVALALGKATQKKHKKVSYYEVKRGKSLIYVASAVGHLYNLHQTTKGWNYPTYDIEWTASHEINKKQAYVKDYIDCIKKLAKKADDVTVACDYDVEGEVIGLNAMRFAANRKDAARMKFSTLTKKELETAYENKSKSINWGQALAGETRHKLDWIYGINISRALTACVKSAGSFKIMSAGRVQGPSLKMLSDKEKEIQAFVPDPYWVLTANGTKGRSKIEALYETEKVFDKKVANKVYKETKDVKKGNVDSVEATQRKQAPPHPFDLTTLQTEAYRCFKFTPKRTLAIAQELYLAGVTSYPRTSSQKLDDKLGLKEILKQIAKQNEYATLANKVLSFKVLKPNNGKKDDPAHPAIYPTGQVPEKLEGATKKLYDLIVKRFLATFAQEATRETVTAKINVNTHHFVCKGTRTVDAQWHEFYAPYVKLDEVSIPEMKSGDEIKIKKVIIEEKETKPPRRFNQSSIIKELEKRNLGTKATRADILQRLFDRGYINGVQITVTDLGLETIKLLEKYMPEIVEEKLTADFEEQMEQVRAHKSEPDQIISKAQTHLTALLKGIKKKEVVIGKEIIDSIKETRIAAAHARVLGEDKKGRSISVRIGRYGPLAQRQDGENDPVYVSLPKGVKIDDVTLEEVLPLFNLPRDVGVFEELPMSAHIGPYGPYIKWNKKFVSIPKEMSPFTIKEVEAIKLVKDKIEADKNRIIKTFDDGTQILKGRYGPYIKKGKKNIKIPKGKKPEELTLEEIKEL